MTDSDTDPLSSLLSSFALGPAWARAAGDSPERTKPKTYQDSGAERPPRRDDRGPRTGAPREGGMGRAPQGRGGNYEDRRNAPSHDVEAPPADGVRTTVAPDPAAVHLIGKEIHQVARVYPLFDVAKILLAEKSRVRAIFEAPEPHAPLIRGKLQESVFLTREEAVRHLWNSELRNDLIEEQTIDVEPPTGNFQAIARCGISGEWLGPVNFYSYQTNLRRLHRERFAKMPFEVYSAKVRTERGEGAVNAWLETTKKKTRWRIKGEDDDAWMDDRAAAERAVSERCFDKAFEETRAADVSGAISVKNLSPSLLTSLKIAGTHARNHPAILIPAVCRAVEAEHLPVFKRQGKLHTGPARPHPLPLNAILAERPGKMVTWIRENSPAKLEGLWKSVLPEGSKDTYCSTRTTRSSFKKPARLRRAPPPQNQRRKRRKKRPVNPPLATKRDSPTASPHPVLNPKLRVPMWNLNLLPTKSQLKNLLNSRTTSQSNYRLKKSLRRLPRRTSSPRSTPFQLPRPNEKILPGRLIS